MWPGGARPGVGTKRVGEGETRGPAPRSRSRRGSVDVEEAERARDRQERALPPAKPRAASSVQKNPAAWCGRHQARRAPCLPRPRSVDRKRGAVEAPLSLAARRSRLPVPPRPEHPVSNAPGEGAVRNQPACNASETGRRGSWFGARRHPCQWIFGRPYS